MASKPFEKSAQATPKAGVVPCPEACGQLRVLRAANQLGVLPHLLITVTTELERSIYLHFDLAVRTSLHNLPAVILLTGRASGYPSFEITFCARGLSAPAAQITHSSLRGLIGAYRLHPHKTGRGCAGSGSRLWRGPC
jgi:hypothetical protein